MRHRVHGARTFLVLASMPIASMWAEAATASCAVRLEQAFEASGGSAWEQHAQLRIEGTVDQAGVHSPFVSVTDLRTGRWRDQRTRGPFELAEGYDGQVAWAEWKPGDVVESNDPAKRRQALTESYERRRAYWLTERMNSETACVKDVTRNGHRYSVHRLTPAGGRTFDLWLDTATRMIARRVERNGIFERTTEYADYRETGGVRLPYRIDSTDYSGNSQQLTVSQISLSPTVDDSAVAKVETRLADYSLPAGQDQVDVPLRLLNNHLYIPVKFNGRGPFWMMLDTGAYCLVTPQLAETLQLHSRGGRAVHGAGSAAAHLDYAKLDTIEIGGAVLRDQRCDVINLQAFADFEGMDQFGVVGYEVYRRFVVRQNYSARSISLIEPSRFAPTRDAQQVPFEYFDYAPQVAGSIDGATGRFFIDTGNRSTASPHTWFIERNGLRERYGRGIDAVSGFGVGGAVKSQLVRSGEIRLGDVAFVSPLLDMGYGDAGALGLEDSAVLVGNGLLKRYSMVTFDYSRRNILFEQPLAYPENDFDRSGLQMKRSANGFLVLDVVAQSPAAEAGLKVGDVITNVDGRAATDWRLPLLRDHLRLSPKGTRVQGEALRGRRQHTFQLTLRDLLPPTSVASR